MLLRRGNFEGVHPLRNSGRGTFKEQKQAQEQCLITRLRNNYFLGHCLITDLGEEEMKNSEGNSKRNRKGESGSWLRKSHLKFMKMS